MSSPPPRPDATLEGWAKRAPRSRPLIWRRIRQLQSGQVLEVVSDDPAAADGVAAWSRLTEHELLTTVDESGGRADDIEKEGFQPLRELDRVVHRERRRRGISDEDLIAGARIVTAAFVVEQLAAGAATLEW